MGTGTHHHDTAFSIVKALGIVAVVISHAAILTPLETFTYYFNTAVVVFVAGDFLAPGPTPPPGPGPRAERKPLDRKKKHPPRYQRENHFWFSFGTQKRTLALMQKRSKPAPQARELT